MENTSTGTGRIATAAPTGTTDTPKTESSPVKKVSGNASESFYKLVDLLYDLYVAISGWVEFINKTLQKQVTDLQLRNKANEMFPPCGPQPRKDKPWTDDEGGFFGGETTDPDRMVKANQLLDYLHSFNLATDVPPEYKTDKNAKLNEASANAITVFKFNSYQKLLTGQIEQLKSSSGLETTKADGTQKSAGAALELGTGFLKAIQTAAATVASNMK